MNIIKLSHFDVIPTHNRHSDALTSSFVAITTVAAAAAVAFIWVQVTNPLQLIQKIDHTGHVATLGHGSPEDSDIEK